ncbi:MAG: molybdopterin-binding protein [Pseudomonadota bacterium]
MSRLPNDCFALPPGVEWTPVDAALAFLKERLAPVTTTETVDLFHAAGRYLATDAIATRAHPATDNAAVDGYAFAHPGTESAVMRLRDGRSAAGAPWQATAEQGPLAAGEAVRIFTGAPMPDGADTVVLQEDVERAGEGERAEKGETIRFPVPKKPGANRRRAGENIAPGAAVLSAGALVTPQSLGQLAAAGLSQIEVHRPLRVGVLSTGDEVADPAGPTTALPPAAVIDSNRPMLLSMIAGFGGEAVDLGIVADDRAAVEARLSSAAAQCDVIVTSGGASGGDEDHMAASLEAAAARREGAFHLWRIAVKPGRPLAMGLWQGCPVFGLPGNPVAAFVCTLIFVAPALRRLGGGLWWEPQPLMVPSGFDYAKKPGRREYLRVRLGADGRLQKYRSEGSGLIEGLLWSDGLADLAHDAGPLKAGEPIRYLPYPNLGLRP